MGSIPLLVTNIKHFVKLCLSLDFRKAEKSNLQECRRANDLTTMSFPAFSGLFAIFIAAAAAAPDEGPTYKHDRKHV